jgi:ATP-dependent phosphofructokinase / diphosphate-dependent phosphofructokinase
MRLGISTGGGDAPGLNAVIRAAVLSALGRGWDVLGIQKGFGGLLGDAGVEELTRDRVRGIGAMGGTMLRTTNRGNPFSWPVKRADGTWGSADRSDELIANAAKLGIDALICIGGDGTLTIAHQLVAKGMRVVGVPKTIDNDVAGTISTFGFDTAVSTAIDAIDKLKTTAESHDRVIVMEVMGRDAGFIALYAGLAAGADAILIPEIPFRLESVTKKILEREQMGRHFSIVVVAEGAKAVGGDVSVMGESMPGQDKRVGGLAGRLAYQLQEATGKESRSLVLGHLQRGGTPTGYDRALATRFGGAAVRAVADGQWGHMVALRSPDIVAVPLAEALATAKRVNLDGDMVRTARETGISFGD